MDYKKYHGAITVANLEGTGCQFTIMLPQAESNHI